MDADFKGIVHFVRHLFS